jgi:RNA polymerase sigma-70 factor (ECF subfamily)
MEQILLEQIKQGNTKAFEAIYHDYYEMLCRFATQILRSSSLAEEVVDDVMFYLWDHRGDLNIKYLRPYLLQAVRNQCLNKLESSAYRKSLSTSEISIIEQLGYLSSIFDEEHPLEQLLYKEKQNKLKEILSSLPEKSRKVFVTCRVEGKKYSEAAAELGITVNTVKYHLKKVSHLLMCALKETTLLLLIIR